MLTLRPMQVKLNDVLLRSLLVGTIAAAGLGFGVVPDFSRPTTPRLANAAVAQDFSEQELRSYARALLEIEPHRQRAYNEIKDQAGSVPNIVCNRRGTFSGLPGNARQIASNYCNQSREIVEEVGLTIERFNQITSRVQDDPRLARRIQDEMRSLQ
ncbi:DUF4168 domain-containing protein [Spirulina sp. CS-785/01]|uniref:DUF4168 domain-containing protein n=1 Tax=Spirulina sp. CS-785/01 TaxID=3021716 RepID=UPI00232D2E60|nr:DUF4168 domain-containing protein [Spirulina sp. CS-785/01]MDB9312541.1 DUF4168 domain-containing protein [Spirulina sp. CS-785/01]